MCAMTTVDPTVLFWLLGVVGFAVALVALFLVVKAAIVSALAEDRRRQGNE